MDKNTIERMLAPDLYVQVNPDKKLTKQGFTVGCIALVDSNDRSVGTKTMLVLWKKPRMSASSTHFTPFHWMHAVNANTA